GRRIKVKFEDDLMRLYKNREDAGPKSKSWLLDFTILHHMYPLYALPKSKFLENTALVKFWVAIRRGSENDRLDKERFVLGIKNVVQGEEVKKALEHLNLLLREKAKEKVEKF